MWFQNEKDVKFSCVLNSTSIASFVDHDQAVKKNVDLMAYAKNL